MTFRDKKVLDTRCALCGHMTTRKGLRKHAGGTLCERLALAQMLDARGFVPVPDKQAAWLRLLDVEVVRGPWREGDRIAEDARRGSTWVPRVAHAIASARRIDHASRADIIRTVCGDAGLLAALGAVLSLGGEEAMIDAAVREHERAKVRAAGGSFPGDEPGMQKGE